MPCRAIGQRDRLGVIVDEVKRRTETVFQRRAVLFVVYPGHYALAGSHQAVLQPHLRSACRVAIKGVGRIHVDAVDVVYAARLYSRVGGGRPARMDIDSVVVLRHIHVILARRTHRADDVQIFVFGHQHHQAGDAALGHHLVYDVGARYADLRAGLLDVVYHDGDRPSDHGLLGRRQPCERVDRLSADNFRRVKLRRLAGRRLPGRGCRRDKLGRRLGCRLVVGGRLGFLFGFRRFGHCGGFGCLRAA